MPNVQEKLNIALVQPDIIWEDKSANLEKYTQLLSKIEEADLILLPEMFTTGFSMAPENLKEPMDGPTVEWLIQTAANKNAVVAGSVIISEEGKAYNRALFAFPDGHVEYYNKRHLFTMGEEHLYYSPGKEKVIINYKGWKICPQVCYDLRFPAFARNQEDYDILIYMANWPSARHDIWKHLLVARAIENQCYCFGINRVGTDSSGLNYRGDSVSISPKGVATFIGSNESIHKKNISYKTLQSFRKKFPVLNDRDSFDIR